MRSNLQLELPAEYAPLAACMQPLLNRTQQGSSPTMQMLHVHHHQAVPGPAPT
jgi:hypothetical protein